MFLNGNYLIGGVDRLGFKFCAQGFSCGSFGFGLIDAILAGRLRGAFEIRELINGGALIFCSAGILPFLPPQGGKDKTGSMELIALIPFA